MKLYLSYDSETHTTRDADPDDPWDAGDETGDFWVTGVSLTPGMRDLYETDEDIKVGDPVWVVYVSYDSGSTFGTSGGYGEIIAVTKSAEAAQAAWGWTEEQIGHKYTRKGKGKKDFAWPSGLTEPAYLSCVGYFEHNQVVKVDNFVVRP